MKKNEVPQQESALCQSNMTELYYVTDEAGNYTTANSTGWEPKALALEESMNLISERVADAKRAVAQGKASPIVYFMELNKMDISILASYVGIWKIWVKRHFKPSVFRKLSDKTLSKYAQTFGISLDELKNFDGHS